MKPMGFAAKVLAALSRRMHLLHDFAKYRQRMQATALPDTAPGSSSFLLVSGRGLDVVWAQLWPIFALALRNRGMRGFVMTSRHQRLLNLYFKTAGLILLFFRPDEDLPPVAGDVLEAVDRCRSFEEFQNFIHDGAPIGEIALSTYSRHHGTGVIDLSDSSVVGYVKHWMVLLCARMREAEQIFEQNRITTLFFTEVFMEEYGAYYYAALKLNLNVIRFAGTVRDDAFILQHLSRESDRMHHSSLDRSTWEAVKRERDDEQIVGELMTNFDDRYSAKWHRSRRNQVSEDRFDPQTMRAALGIAPDRKVAIVYSHILYDTLFFFGTDIYDDYSQWLIETVRIAIENPQIDWLIKIHPSNLWRGELDDLLGGKYEEQRLVEQFVGKLPDHVRLIDPDTRYNPLNWFRFADYGITVRGTSGLEMAALGKRVVTAGTGRYESNGFTIDPADRDAYRRALLSLHELGPLSPDELRLAQRYAHAIFVRKPFTLTSAEVALRSGVTTVRASGDLAYFPKLAGTRTLPADLTRFADWALTPSVRDLLTPPVDSRVDERVGK